MHFKLHIMATLVELLRSGKHRVGTCIFITRLAWAAHGTTQSTITCSLSGEN